MSILNFWKVTIYWFSSLDWSMSFSSIWLSWLMGCSPKPNCDSCEIISSLVYCERGDKSTFWRTDCIGNGFLSIALESNLICNDSGSDLTIIFSWIWSSSFIGSVFLYLESYGILYKCSYGGVSFGAIINSTTSVSILFVFRSKMFWSLFWPSSEQVYSE